MDLHKPKGKHKRKCNIKYFPPPTHTQHLCDSLVKYFTTNSQVKLYRSTVLTIVLSGHGEIQVEDQVCLHWGGSSNLKLNALF